MIIFDWDDTLLPTSQLRTGMPMTDDDVRAHAELVEQVLRAARAVAHVSIVTLSKNNWVLRSGEKFLSSLDLPTLLEELEITIYYAMEEPTVGPKCDCQWQWMKRSSMERCLRSWHSRSIFAGDGPSSVLSIGDSVAEQLALKDLFSSGIAEEIFVECRRPVCKTMKLMGSPTLCELSEELMRLAEHLPTLVQTLEPFDLDVDDPLEIEEVCASLAVPPM